MLNELRTNWSGKVYIYCRDKETMLRFLQDAETQGYHIGDKKPTECKPDDLFALERGHEISYAGIVGHMAMQAKEPGIKCVDYEKYIGGNANYLVYPATEKEFELWEDETGLPLKFGGYVVITGERREEAASYLSTYFAECPNEDEQNAMLEWAADEFDVEIEDY